MTANQLVAYNLHRARTERGLTQDQAAELLEPYLGTRWKKASFSAAERSISSDRIREFTADEILAFAKAFDLPVTWFFLPPDAADHDRFDEGSHASVGSVTLSHGQVLDAVLNATGPTQERLTMLLHKELSPEERSPTQ